MHDLCMAIKTISLDLEAYEALARHKRKGESFSRVVKEHFGRRKAAKDLVRVVGELKVSPETIEATATIVRARRRHPATAPKL